MLESRTDWIEIDDKEFLTLMKRDFYRNYLHYKTLAPIICGKNGTVVNHGYNQGARCLREKAQNDESFVFYLTQYCTQSRKSIESSSKVLSSRNL